MTPETIDNCEKYSPVTLEDIEKWALLNRIDTKYVFPGEHLCSVLKSLQQHYHILEIEGHKIFTYHNLYFDTGNFDMFLDHHNGKLNRYKIRFREYVETQTRFLEIKFKNNKERTIKTRVKVKALKEELSSEEKKFLAAHSKYDPACLLPLLYGDFNRISLVHKYQKERVTFDFNLSFQKKDDKKKLDKVAIAELKQDKFHPGSVFAKKMKEMGILPDRMSKYCLGTSLTNKQLKYNNFKPLLEKITRISSSSEFKEFHPSK
jgi:hypothetical protein